MVKEGSDIYYSQRNSEEPCTYDCDNKFWTSSHAYFGIIAENGYLHQNFGYFNEQDMYYTVNWLQIEKTMLFKLGHSVNLLTSPGKKSNAPTTEQQLDLIEFFYEYVSEPTDYEYIEYYRYSEPVKFDIAKARYQYTVEINNLFKRHRVAYKMEKGKIYKVHSKVLDEYLRSEDITINKQLRLEINQAIKLFQSRDSNNVKTALTVMANAFEMAKTLSYPPNKRKSVEIICKNIAKDNEELQKLLNSHFSHITHISNNCDIRHKESGKILVEDKNIQEYLFYTYYNSIRLMIENIEILENS